MLLQVLVFEVVPEQAGVIVGTRQFVAVFATGEEPDFVIVFFSQSFEEELQQKGANYATQIQNQKKDLQKDVPQERRKNKQEKLPGRTDEGRHPLLIGQ